jgi:hypothetical protein
MLHAGAQALTRAQIAKLPEPEVLGSRHNPLPFITDIELVEQELARYDLVPTEEVFGVLFAHNKPTRFFGVMELATEQQEHALVVGLRGSYDQSISRGLAVGSRVFVCDNLAFSGEVAYMTRQTTNVGERLPKMIAEAASRVPALGRQQQLRFNQYRGRTIGRRLGDAYLVELLRLAVLNTQTLGRAATEWIEPSHPEHAEDGYTLWRLHNAVTEALKAKDPDQPGVFKVWDRTINLTKFLDRELLA